MAEFNLARVRRHMCRGLVILGLLVSNTMSIGNQQTVKAPFAIASVQATRNSIRKVSFNETVRTDFFMKILQRSGNTTATERSILIATKCKTEKVHERLTKMPKASAFRLVVRLWKNVLWLMYSRRSGRHIKVSIRSAIAKLSRS